jgi:hypothetical protein
MNTPAPPRLASWLLRKFGSAYCSESLAGDLHEEWRKGRGDGWYWRQVCIALLLNACQIIRVHGLTFALAVGSYQLTIWLSRFGRWPAERFAYARRQELFEAMGATPFALSSAKFAEDAIVFVWFAIIFLAQGYIVGRLHRPHPKTAAILAMALFVWVPNIPPLMTGFSLLAEYGTESRVLPGMLSFAFFLAQNIVFVLIGATWLASRWPRQPPGLAFD